MATVYLSLGSNLGDRHALLGAALDMLQERVGCMLALSPFYETEPWGFESPHCFLNAVVVFRTAIGPRELLSVTQGIEKELGRTHKSADGIYHDRPIDIDILIHTSCPQMQTEELILPHPHMWKRDFVRLPLLDVAPLLRLDKPLKTP